LVGKDEEKQPLKRHMHIKLGLNKIEWMVCTGFIWLNGDKWGCWGHFNEPLGSVKSMKYLIWLSSY